MRFVARVVSMIFLVFAVIAGLVDAIQSVAAEQPILTPLMEAWSSNSPDTLALLEGLFQTHLPAWAWDPGALWVLAQPAIAAFRQFDPVLEEASYSLGAGWGTTMRRVAAPLVLPGLDAGGSLAFVTALGEFVASILLYTHRTRPISMEILAQLRAFDFGAAAAMGVLLALLMAVVFMVGGKFIRGSEAPRA